MLEEIWKDIKNYEGLYQISNLGRVRSLDRYVRGYNHGVEFESLIKGKIIKPRPNKCGYPIIGLSKEGKKKHYALHRLVYYTFNPNADKSLQVNHLDENKLNCSLSNLNLMTAKENSNWGTRNERIKTKVAGVKKGPMSEENKMKISEGLKLSEKAQKAIKKLHLKQSIPIVQLTLNGEYINEYISAAEAQRQTNIHSQSINACCRHERNTAGGCIWLYKKEWAA